MAMGGQRFLLLVVVASLVASEGREAGAQPASYAAAGHVVMPHPHACACSNEEKSHREKLWDKLRPGHRDRYVTRQHVRHLNHPECPPWCMENFGYYQTCWRRFPEHTLGCRYCGDSSSPPLPAAPLPATVSPVPMAVPQAPLPTPIAPPSLPSEPKPIPPEEYDSPPAAEPELEDVRPTITPTAAWWNDPAWQAGLRSPSRSGSVAPSDIGSAESARVPGEAPNLNDPAWKAGLRSAR